MNEKILCVDDEQSILDGFQRNLRQRFTVVTHTSGEEALKQIPSEGPFAVIVSDMRMPGMDGVHFLARAKDVSPDSVRIMLTGNSDLSDAIKAVNEGNIFRFLAKPCPSETLLIALDAAVQQYHLVKAEQELLEKTVKGCVQVLTDMLALANPFAMSRTTRVRYYVKQIALALGLGKIWQLEIAAMLSHIGCAAIPSDVMKRSETEASVLPPEDAAMLRNHPHIARDLIATVPRLEFVAEIVAHQNDSFKAAQADSSIEGAVLMGSSILKAAGDLDVLLSKSNSLDTAINIMELRTRNSGEYNPAVTRVLHKIEKFERTGEMEVRMLAQLENGMILAKDIRTLSNRLLLSEGHQLNTLTRLHLQNQLTKGNMKDEFYVWKRH
jgi:FixJ family two-component response regulator